MVSVSRSGSRIADATAPTTAASAVRLKQTWARIARLAACSWVLGILPVHGEPPATSYGSLPEQVLQICQPRIEFAGRPAILLIHGGGWTTGDKASLAARCRTMASFGYTVLNINYRLADGAAGHAWPAALEDARQALTWLRANAATLGVDRRRIGIVGQSAGAQLAVFLGVAGLRDGIVCVVEESGPIDLLSAASFTSVVDPAVFTARPIEDAYRSASPVFRIERTSAPTMIVHGRADPLVPFSQAEELLAALRRKSVPAVMLDYAGGHIMQDTTSSERERVIAAEMAYLNTHLGPDDGVGNAR